MDIQMLPQQEQRVETGVVQFGDDWPGVFIRGDDAFAFALYLGNLLNRIPKSTILSMNSISDMNVSALLELLKSCRLS
jgi:hypothetical protein